MTERVFMRKGVKMTLSRGGVAERCREVDVLGRSARSRKGSKSCPNFMSGVVEGAVLGTGD